MAKKKTKRCTAKSKTTGARCQRAAAPGSNVCNSHGAKGGRPIVHGRYSERLPFKLREIFAAVLADPNLKSLNEDIALNKTFILESMAGIEACYDSLVEPMEELRKAAGSAKIDPKKIESACAQVLTAFDKGIADQERMKILERHTDRRQRLIETDARQLRTSKEGLSPTESAAYMSIVTEAIIRVHRKHKVEHAATILSEIAREIDAAYGRSDGAATRRTEST